MAPGASASTPTKWRFPATVNAPWAFGDQDTNLDTPDAAAGLCRTYAPFGDSTTYSLTSDVERHQQ